MHISGTGFHQTFHDKSQNFSTTVINVCFHLDNRIFGFLIFSFRIISDFRVFEFFCLSLFFIYFCAL